MKYYVIIPAHNEEAFLAETLESLARQTLAPIKVVIVNDHSSDGTEEIIDRFTAQYSHFVKRNRQSASEHMPGSKVVATFNYGLALLDEAYDFIVKLDADIILPPRYFESIANIFAEHPDVGIAGGFAYEQDSRGHWKLNHPMNKDHVRGAFKAYTKSCFSAIHGLKPAMGWDTVDELLASYHGFKTFTDETLEVKHLRPLGAAYNRRAKFLQGEAMYTMRYGFLITLIASLKMALKFKKPRAVVDNLRGFLSAKKARKPYIVSADEGKFIRSRRWQGIRSKLF